VFLVAVAAMAIFVASPFGAAVRGTRDQPRRMTALGYNVWMIRFLAFLFSGFWCGIAGLLYLYNKQFISPQVSALQASAEVLLMVISGGTATLLGPVAGAAIVIIVKYSLNAVADVLTMVISDGATILLGPIAGADIAIIVKDALNVVAARWNLVLGVVFVAIISFMPEGLVPGSVRLWRTALRRLRALPVGKLRVGAPQ